jgi:hypothetical protein
MPFNNPSVSQHFEFPEGRDPRQNLISMVLGLQRLLWFLAESRWKDDRNPLLIPTVYHQPLIDALRELDPHYGNLIEKTERLEDGSLDDHGLRGAQLRVKLHGIRDSFAKFFSNPIKGALKTLLEAIDVALDSLIQATGVGGAVKEIKDCIKVLLSIED